jgi:predicted kinase
MPAFPGDDAPLFVVVNGPPGSGKTRLAGRLAERLHLPLIAKDTIKEALMSVLDVPDVEASRRLGRASMEALLRTAAACTTGAVLDANFRRSIAVHELGRLPGCVVEVFCVCSREVCLARYRDRATHRAPGHFDGERSDEEIWNEEVTQPVAGDWPVVRIDTDRPVDPDLDEALILIDRARATAGRGRRDTAMLKNDDTSRGMDAGRNRGSD